MDIHVTKKISKSWEVVYVIKKVRQLFSKHRVSNIVLLVGWRAVKKKYIVCCTEELLMPALL